MRTIAILGPGGVGGFLAAALARPDGWPGAVTVVARESTAGAIAREGIRVSSVRLGELLDFRNKLSAADVGVVRQHLAAYCDGLEHAAARYLTNPLLLRRGDRPPN